MKESGCAVSNSYYMKGIQCRIEDHSEISSQEVFIMEVRSFVHFCGFEVPYIGFQEDTAQILHNSSVLIMFKFVSKSMSW